MSNAAEQAGAFILSSRRQDGRQRAGLWPAMVQATIRSKWPEVTLVRAYREAALQQGRERDRRAA